MSRKLVAVGGLALLLAASPSWAETKAIEPFKTVASLAEICKPLQGRTGGALSPDAGHLLRQRNEAACLGYINGALQSHLVTIKLGELNPIICAGESTLGDWVLVFRAFAATNPQMKDAPPAYSVIKALMDAYPCKENEGR